MKFTNDDGEVRFDDIIYSMAD